MEKIWIEIPKLLFFQEGPGVRNHQYTTEGVKLLNVANLVDGRVDLTTSDRYISEEEAYGKYSHFLVEDGDFIIASSGIKVDYFEKKMGFVDKTQLPLCMNTSTIRFKTLDEKKLDIKYFMYYLKSMSFKHQLSRQITGSAQLNFGPSHLKLMKVPVVNIEIQRDIIVKLEKLEKIISARSKQLEEYDTLIKSRFVEMFGAELNETAKELSEVCFKVTDGTHQSPKFVQEGIPFIFISNIQDYKVTYDTEKFISEETYNELTKSTPIEKGDVLLTTVGSYGNPAVVDGTKKFCFQRHIAHLKVNDELINSYYLHAALRVSYVRQQIDRRVKGIAQKTLNLSELKKVKINVPNMTNQKEFVMFLGHIDKLKSEVQKSLDETQILFDSLMQEYFE